MDLQWQQLVTHLVGFVITVWLLKKFAWAPLLLLLEERRNKIAGEFQTIENEKQKIADLETEYEAKLKEIDSVRRQKLTEAVNEGKRIAEEMRVTAREEAREIVQKARADLDRDVAKAKVQLKEEMIAITMSAAEKILHEKLDDAKHRELIGNYIDNVEKA